MTFSILFALSLVSFAKKCDNYVAGRVWEHKTAGADDSGNGAVYQGCKKGCFWNQSYFSDGVRKCEKCTDIKDELTCTNNDATCLWKKGKCKSQSCPQIAKTRNTGSFIVNNNEVDVTKGRAKLMKECVEGSPLEQEYNNRYFDDYKKNKNLEFYKENCDQVDKCINPCSAAWNPGNDPNVNRQNCNARFGCVYYPWTEMDPSDDRYNPVLPRIPDPQQDRCVYPCSDFERDYYNTEINIARCNAWGNAVSPCRWNQYDCEPVSTYSNGPICTGFNPGTSNRAHCTRLGCFYTGTDRGDGTYLSTTDNCTARRGYGDSCSGFVAGSATDGTEDKCRALGCTFVGVNPVKADGNRDLVKCGEFRTNCTDPLLPPSVKCSVNRSLALTEYRFDGILITPPKICDDRLFPNTATSTTYCRQLYDITRQKCIFDYDELLSEEVHINKAGADGQVSGPVRPGTKYELCMEKQETIIDPYVTVQGDLNAQGLRVPKTVGISDADRRNLYGFSTPKEYCDHERALRMKECENAYNTAIQYTCYATEYTQPIEKLQRSHLQTKAARAACHQIYGCMYSKINERCSVWAVWALILAIVLSVVVVVGVGAAVGVFFVVLKK